MAHRVERLALAHDEAGAGEPPQHGEGELARRRRDDRVADRAARRRVALALPARQRARRVVEALGLARAHAQPRRRRLERERDPRREAAAAAAHEHVGVGDAGGRRLLGDLEADGALPRDHLRVVERLDQRHAALRRDPPANLLAALRLAVVQHHLGAVRLRVRNLERRRVLGHHDDRRDAERLRRARDALPVVAAAVRDDAARALGVGNRRDRAPRAADLERARALQALGLDEDAPANQLVEKRRREQRRAHDVVADARLRRADRIDRRRLAHRRERPRAAHDPSRADRGARERKDHSCKYKNTIQQSQKAPMAAEPSQQHAGSRIVTEIHARSTTIF